MHSLLPELVLAVCQRVLGDSPSAWCPSEEREREIEMVWTDQQTASVSRFYPQNVHQPWPLALKSVWWERWVDSRRLLRSTEHAQMTI